MSGPGRLTPPVVPGYPGAANASDRMLQGALDAIAKRVLDFLGAVVFLTATAPLMAVAALFVRLSSPGPILFRQQRVGRNGELFWLLKFRTMHVANDGPSVTAGGDDRVTPVGRWLRRWKLDELPQFLNVLRGEMSLVGPRPEVPRYVQHYTEEQRSVLRVRPGITGVSQLAFRHEEQLLAGQEDVETFYLCHVMPAKLQLDLRYVQERTFWGDFLLILRTAAAVVGHPFPRARRGNR